MKTSNSQKKAVRAYEESKDIIRGIFPKGTKDRIISAGYTYNGFLNEAVERFFHDLETPTAPDFRAYRERFADRRRDERGRPDALSRSDAMGRGLC